MAALGCSGAHDGCKPWGWRLVAAAHGAHFFERVVDETALEVYASSHSLCGAQQIGNAGEHWRCFVHVGIVPLCPKCCERLLESPPKETEAVSGSRPNPLRLARSLELLAKVNAWRLRRAQWPKHVGAELAYVEAQLEQHDSDCRAGLRPEQRTIFEYMQENANK